MSAADVTIVDVPVGVMTTVLPPLAPPVFLRLGSPMDPTVDGARRAYLQAADADLRTCRADWRDGPGLFVDRTPSDPDQLVAEVHEVGRALRVLADAAVARSYLELMEPRVGPDPGPDARTDRGG